MDSNVDKDSLSEIRSGREMLNEKETSENKELIWRLFGLRINADKRQGG